MENLTEGHSVNQRGVSVISAKMLAEYIDVIYRIIAEQRPGE